MERTHTNILMVAAARTGSTRLTLLCSAYPELNALGEIFNVNADPTSPFRSTQLLCELGAIASNDHRLARDFCLSKPLEVLRIFEGNGKTNVLKVAPNHLPTDVLSDLIKTQISGVIFLTRNPIDSFISLQKARMVKAWGRVDTTDIRVTLTVPEFVNYCRKLNEFYEFCLKKTAQNSLPAISMCYETDINIPDRAAHASLYKKLVALGVQQKSTALTAMGEGHVFKQDKNLDYASKVTNWDEFVYELACQGNLRLMRTLPCFRSLRV